MTDIKSVTITVARPRGSFPGKVETGWYTVNDGIYKFTRKLTPGADPKLIACSMLRDRYPGGKSGDFNRKLVYPKLVY